MTSMEQHPMVRKYREGHRAPPVPMRLNAEEFKQKILDLGAGDVGFVEIDRPEIGDQRKSALSVLPKTKTFISYVIRMNRTPIRSTARSIANVEFHETGEKINEVGMAIVRFLEDQGYQALNPAMGFPMEMGEWPNQPWVISHKPIAQAAGLGVMGIHRNIIHPKFGNFVLLGTIITDAEVSSHEKPLDYNPCLSCKLCVAACPTGAIKPDGSFDFNACYTHNYREFMSGFGNWVEQIADSKNAKDYRSRVEDKETVSMWQSLGFGPNYKAAYCMSVCPAGEDVIGSYLDDKKNFVKDVVKPLQAKQEDVYVVPGSDAEAFVAKKFPHKRARRVSNGLRPTTVRNFLGYLPHLFQKAQAKDLSATYHFDFYGEEKIQATVTIDQQKLKIQEGHVGIPTLKVKADSKRWIQFIRKDKGLVGALLTRKIRVQGSPKYLFAFARCFPS